MWMQSYAKKAEPPNSLGKTNDFRKKTPKSLRDSKIFLIFAPSFIILTLKLLSL
jgi:hypothetical protein